MVVERVVVHPQGLGPREAAKAWYFCVVVFIVFFCGCFWPIIFLRVLFFDLEIMSICGRSRS